MKVSELEGAELDYWVARAEGMRKGRENYVAYSEKWAAGGPIIEREFIDSLYHHDGKVWQCSMFDRGDIQAFGKTKLIAAMRCYVTSKFGEEVDDRQADHI